MHIFHPLLHFHKLCSKHRGFYHCLLLLKPVHKSRIHINKVARPGPPCSRIRDVVRVDEYTEIYLSSQSLGTVVRDLFLNVSVQLFPFMFLEVRLVNRRVCRVFAYPKLRHNSRMVFDPTYPSIDKKNFQEHEWKRLYGALILTHIILRL